VKKKSNIEKLLLAAFFTAFLIRIVFPSSRQASFVFDAETGEVLHQVNADVHRYPASLTKMMTLYLLFSAIDQGSINMATMFPVSVQAAAQPASKIGLCSGDSIRVRDAILCLITKSANDVALVVAEALAGSESRFAMQMNKQAKILGMEKTNFCNASGLPDNRQKTTARDMAKLAYALWRDFPHYYHFFSTTSFHYHGRDHENQNKLLEKFPGVDGLKTGYIRASGFNLAASAEKGGCRLFAVVMGGKSPRDRNTLMAKLLNKSFSCKNTNADEQKFADWTLQIGAFRNFNSARDFLKKIFDLLGLQQDNQEISVVKSIQGRFYRALLTGFSEQQARMVKNRLDTIQIESFLIPPSGK
jgi:D-alanyl-D-alanine carboxypeptidase